MKINEITEKEKNKAFAFRNKYFKKDFTKQIKELRLKEHLRIIYNEFNCCLNVCGNDFPLLFGVPNEYITVSLANKLIKEVGLGYNQFGYVKEKYK